MESLCTPTIATAALFTALIFLDLFRREYKLLPAHGFFGILSTLLVSILCQQGAVSAAWALLAFPFVILFLGFLFLATRENEQGLRYPISSSASRGTNPCGMCRQPAPRCRCPAQEPSA